MDPLLTLALVAVLVDPRGGPPSPPAPAPVPVVRSAAAPAPEALGHGAADPGSGPGSTRWQAPVPAPVTVLRGFEPPSRPWGPGHRGVDLGAAEGTVVRAAGAGTVTFAAVLAGRGVVVVAHPDGLRTTYEPVRALVVVGEVVARGAPIGVLGAGDGHCGAEPCLHWGLRRGRAYLDPMLLLHPGRVVLLPP